MHQFPVTLICCIFCVTDSSSSRAAAGEKLAIFLCHNKKLCKGFIYLFIYLHRSIRLYNLCNWGQ